MLAYFPADLQATCAPNAACNIHTVKLGTVLEQHISLSRVIFFYQFNITSLIIDKSKTSHIYPSTYQANLIMALIRTMKSAVGVARILSSRMVSTSSSTHVEQPSRTAGVDMANFDPKNYSVPIRPYTMDDMMEPYGPWKMAYDAERKLANKTLLKGLLCLSASLIFLFNSGALEGLDMPNLDNIMEETEPFNFDTEGRVSVTRD